MKGNVLFLLNVSDKITFYFVHFKRLIQRKKGSSLNASNIKRLRKSTVPLQKKYLKMWISEFEQNLVSPTISITMQS